MNRRRGGVGVSVDGNGFLYALGGHDCPPSAHKILSDTVERYDPATDTWTLVCFSLFFFFFFVQIETT